MNRSIVRKLLCCAAVLLIALSGAAAARAAPVVGDWGDPVVSDKREWTILVYLDGDNNLEYQALYHLKTLERNIVSADGKADVVVLFDRAKGFETTYEDWTETRAYHVTPSARNDEINSELLANCGELNMASPAVLEAFIREGLRKYPAPKVALVLWNHGGTWIGLIDDNDAPGTERGSDTMTLDGMTGVLSRTSSLFPNGKLELLVLEMCLMGQTEVATACAPFAKYMLAAPTVVSALGMGYVGALDLFAKGAGSDAIVVEMLKRGTEGLRYRKDWSISAYDLSKVDGFNVAFKTLSDKLGGMMSTGWSEVTRTAFYAQNYGGRNDHTRGQGAIGSVDLLDWFARLKKGMKNPPLAEMDAVEKAAKAMILATENGPQIPYGNGLSLYLPLRGDNLIPRYGDTDFAKKTGWPGTLSKLHAAQAKDGMEAPRVTSIEFGLPVPKPGVAKPKWGEDYTITPKDEVIPISGGAMEGSWVKLIMEGRNILWGYAGFGLSDTDDPDGDYTMAIHTILLDQKLWDPEEKAKKEEEAASIADALTPVFKDGKNEMLYKFGGLVHKFSNGEKSVMVTADFLDVTDMTHAVVPGTYSDPSTEGELPVEVKIDTQFYEIDSLTAIVPNEGGGSTTFPVEPKPEGVFRPLLNKRLKDGSVRMVPGEPIQWKKGLSVIMELMPEGKYTKAIGMAESMGGGGGIFVSRPVRVKANPLLSPYLDVTHKEGGEKLLGRYAVVLAVPRRDDGVGILAPSGSSMELKMGPRPDREGQGLQAIQRIPGEDSLTTYLSWQPEGLPMISRFLWDEEEREFIVVERYNAVLVPVGQRYFWRLLDSYDGSPLHLIPLTEDWFPRGGLESPWAGEDGSRLNLSGGQAVYTPPDGNGIVSGRYETTDNVVTITPLDGGEPMVFAFCHGDAGSLVVSFQDSESAMIYKQQQAPQETQPKRPPTRPIEPQPPIDSRPPVHVPPPPPPPPPPQQIDLNGMWGTYFNGQPLVMQIQGSPAGYQYQAWLNGMPFEAGVFQIQGNAMYGQTTMGAAYTNYFQWNPNGMAFSITSPITGITLVYQRMQ